MAKKRKRPPQRRVTVHRMRGGVGWKLIAAGFETQADAEEFGRLCAKRIRCEFRLGSRRGTFREQDSYGHDSRKRKG